MLAISTAWNALKHAQAEDMIAEIKSLGFEHIELNFNLTTTMVKQILSLKKRRQITVVSLHNFCPIPAGIARQKASPDMFALSALDEEERRLALRYTKQTIAWAERFGAQAVILHIGRVKMDEKTKKLAFLLKNKRSKEFKQTLAGLAVERKAKAKRYLVQTYKSLEALCRQAQSSKINIGLENRYYFSEIPSFGEIQDLLREFPGPPVFYWHDVGHAQVYEHLGIIKHQQFLDKFSRRMIGMHLHDIEGIDDHRAPLKGQLDFSLLKPYLNENILKVLEPHQPATKKEIMKGKIFLEKLLADRPR